VQRNDDWTDPEVWKKANPSLGITVGIDKVQQACESAKQNPGEENAFRQLRLNQWVKQAVRWMPMEKWDACAFPTENELEGRVCYGGLDLSSHNGYHGIRVGVPAGR
jgi:phage terminase large subunit-like protein